MKNSPTWPMAWSWPQDGLKKGMIFRKSSITMTIKKVKGDDIDYIIDYGSKKEKGEFNRITSDIASFLANHNWDRIK